MNSQNFSTFLSSRLFCTLPFGLDVTLVIFQWKEIQFHVARRRSVRLLPLWLLTTDDLMGDGAVALEKSISGRVLDFIGWRVNVNSRLIILNERNFHKLLYGFWSVDIHASLSFLTLRQLSGRSARYQVILRPLKMLISILFASHGEFSHRNKYVSLKSEAY